MLARRWPNTVLGEEKGRRYVYVDVSIGNVVRSFAHVLAKCRRSSCIAVGPHEFLFSGLQTSLWPFLPQNSSNHS